MEISVNSILVEENEDTYLGLKDTLSKAGFDHRVKRDPRLYNFTKRTNIHCQC